MIRAVAAVARAVAAVARAVAAVGVSDTAVISSSSSDTAVMSSLPVHHAAHCQCSTLPLHLEPEGVGVSLVV